MPLCSPLAPVRVPRVYPACVEQKGRLSGFVPFVQVSDNAHKRDVEAAVADARTHIYFRDAQSAERALSALTALRAELLSAADANDANTNADTNADTNQLLEWPRCAKDCTADGLDDTCMRMCHGLCCCASAAAC